MNRWRVGEERGSKEIGRCPLTSRISLIPVVGASGMVVGAAVAETGFCL
jgi:hypothetical protein